MSESERRDSIMKNIKRIRTSGVLVKSDMCLWEPFTYDSHSGAIIFISIYGATQQVQAIFAALAAGKDIRIEDEVFRLKRTESPISARSRAIGRGKRHMLIWSPETVESSAIWMKDEKERAIEDFLVHRKVPYDKEYLEDFEVRLLDEGMLKPLSGWGDIHGYSLQSYCDKKSIDNKLCGFMLEVIWDRSSRSSGVSESNISVGRAMVRSKELECVL